MAFNENSPRSPSKHKRKSLQDAFPGLSISKSNSPTKSKAPVEMKILQPVLKGTLRRGWPPSLRLFGGFDEQGRPNAIPSPFTLRMSQDYRAYDDRWRTDRKVKDQPEDVSIQFRAAQQIMDEISEMLSNRQAMPTDLEQVLTDEMALAVYGSNNLRRCGMGLDETLKMCRAILRGEEGFEFTERSDEYRARLEANINKGASSQDPTEKLVMRSRREVVQHAAAFQHIVNAFVKHDQPLTEDLIKETHRILTDKLSGEDSGSFNYQSFAGTYRRGDQQAYVGATRFTKPGDVPKAMKAMIEELHKDLEEAEERANIDPFALAAKYCDRMVNIHPFKDGNGRMCRLILNAILLKYAGIVVTLGERDQDRDSYIAIANESARVGGHAGALAKLVLESAGGTLRKLKSSFRRHVRSSSGY